MNPAGHLLRTLQFTSGSAQGAISLGNPEEGQMSPNDESLPSSSSTDTDDDRDTTDLLRMGAIILAVVVGGVAGLVFSTWAIAYSVDFLCCCCPWFQPIVDPDEYNRQYDRTPLARKARLWGLTLTERATILRAFFEKRVFVYEKESPLSACGDDDDDHDDMETDDEKDRETKAPANERDTETASMEAIKAQAEGDISQETVSTNPGKGTQQVERDNAKEDPTQGDAEKHDGGAEADEETGEEQVTALNEADHERLCAICLTEYTHGESRLITGTQCIHQFHYTCCLEWLNKPNDQCPYCRMEMLNASQFRQAALKTLGVARVRELGAATQEPATVVTVPLQAENASASINTQEQETLHDQAIAVPLQPTAGATSESEVSKHHNDPLDDERDAELDKGNIKR